MASDSPVQDTPKSETFIADIASIVAHEFNNCLNGMLLHIAILEQEGPPGRREEFKPLQKLGQEAARLVRDFQRLNHRERPQSGAVDLDDLVRQAVSACGSRSQVRIILPPSSGPIRVQANEAELSRVLRLLFAEEIEIVSAAVSAPTAESTAGEDPAKGSAPPGEIHVRLEKLPSKARLTIDDSGPTIAVDLLNKACDCFIEARKGSAGWMLPVCRYLGRRMRGSLSLENRTDGGTRTTLELPLAEEAK